MRYHYVMTLRSAEGRKGRTTVHNTRDGHVEFDGTGECQMFRTVLESVIADTGTKPGRVAVMYYRLVPDPEAES